MKCPSCSKVVKDGTAICPHCDAILDDSILGDMPAGDSDGDDTPPPAPAPKKKAAAKPAAGARKPLRPAPVSSKEPEARPEASRAEEAAAPSAGKWDQYWEEDEDEKSRKKVSRDKEDVKEKAVAAKAARSTREGESEVDNTGMEDTTKQLKETWALFTALPFEEKLATVGGLGLAVLSFMPWRGNTDGEDMGLMTWGFFALLFGVAVMFGMYSKNTGKLPMVPAKAWPFLPIGAGALTAFICVIFIFSSFDRTMVSGKAVTTSWPSFGSYGALLCSGLLVLSGLLLKKREGT